jgi:hypothetical protein
LGLAPPVALDRAGRPVLQRVPAHKSPPVPEGFAVKNLLALLAAAVLVFLGAGYYLDWYRIRPTGADANRQSFNVDINGKKIRDDVNRGVKDGAEKLHDVIEGVEKRPDSASANKS